MSEQELHCPVCGYYCLGKGGAGCIDKPAMLRKKEELDAALWDMAERQSLSASQAREAELREEILELEQRVKVLTDEFDRVTNMPLKWYVSEREARFVFATLEARDEFVEYMIGSKVLKGTPLPKDSDSPETDLDESLRRQ